MENKGFTPIIVIIIAALSLAALGGAGYVVVQRKAVTPPVLPSPSPQISPLPVVSPSPEISPSPSPIVADCIVTGCSGQICSDEDVITTCEWREEYACYRTAKCERQTNGKCGWTMTDILKVCLQKAKVSE